MGGASIHLWKEPSQIKRKSTFKWTAAEMYLSCILQEYVLTALGMTIHMVPGNVSRQFKQHVDCIGVQLPTTCIDIGSTSLSLMVTILYLY